MTNPRLPIHAPRGTELSARSWQTEAPLRMLMNNLDPANAERPEDLVVYGGTGRAARSWEAYDALVRTLQTLADDETMLVQSGKPVGVMKTHEWAPRVLIANSNLVGDWATWPEFRRLEQLGLTMYGQMTAGSWIYIGTQGILQGTYETFAAVAAKKYGGDLAGTLTLTGGCGGMGGAQPLAVTMNGGVCLIVEVDPERLERRVRTRYLDTVASDLDDAVAEAEAAKRGGEAKSIGVVGNAAEVFPELLRRGVAIDIVTDQTSAHDPLSYVPAGVDPTEAAELARADADGYTDRARESMAYHVAAMVDAYSIAKAERYRGFSRTSATAPVVLASLVAVTMLLHGVPEVIGMDVDAALRAIGQGHNVVPSFTPRPTLAPSVTPQLSPTPDGSATPGTSGSPGPSPSGPVGPSPTPRACPQADFSGWAPAADGRLNILLSGSDSRSDEGASTNSEFAGAAATARSNDSRSNVTLVVQRRNALRMTKPSARIAAVPSGFSVIQRRSLRASSCSSPASGACVSSILSRWRYMPRFSTSMYFCGVKPGTSAGRCGRKSKLLCVKYPNASFR